MMSHSFSSAVLLTSLLYGSPISLVDDNGGLPILYEKNDEEKLDCAFLKNGFLYSIQRKGAFFHYDEPKNKAVVWTLTVYKQPFNENRGNHFRGEEYSHVFKDGIGVVDSRSFMRWHLTRERLWGTGRTLDDDFTGIFNIPSNRLRQVELKIRDPEGGVSVMGLQNYWGGSILIKRINGYYWSSRGVFHHAMATMPGENGWPVGSKGIYFDFIPNNDDETIMLFILFEKGCIKHSESRNLTLRNSLIETWVCTSRTDPTKNTSIPLPPRKNVAISTELDEPFYAFERNGDYYFTSLSGRIFVAPLLAVDVKIVERLIGQLDDDSFSIREDATRALRTIGKPAQGLMEAQLPKVKSAEQRRRISQLVGELKRFPDRETKLLWQDEKRPVNKLLFDQDKNKVYAFTKPNRDKQVYFFEIADKPQPRLFTGNVSPASPASLPPSVRQFLEYARFVRKEK